MQVRSDVAIRQYSECDFDMLCELLGDPEMTQFLGGPESLEALQARHQRYLAADPATNGIFTVILGDVEVGWVGFWEIEWEGEPGWECGWHVRVSFQRQGIATAAATLALRSAAARRRHRWMHAFPSLNNVASNALCRTIGFELLGEADVEYPKGSMMHAAHWRFDLHSIDLAETDSRRPS